MASNKALIEMIAQGQAQRIRENQLMQQTQADYDAWLKQQPPQIEDNFMQQVQADFDAWANANPIQTQPVQPVQKVETPKKEEAIPSLADFFKPTTASGRDINKETAQKLHREDYQRQQQLEQIQAERPDTRRGTEAWNESVNDTLNILNSDNTKIIKALNKAAENEKRKKEANKPINSGINQVDLSKYNLPSEGFTEEEKKTNDDYTKALKWSDPNYRMTKEEQQEARRIASEGKQALAEKYPVENKADFGKLYERMSPEDQEKYNTFDDLSLKADPLSNISIGAADKAVNMLGGALNAVAFFHPEARQAAKDYQKLQNKFNEIKEPTVDLSKSATPFAENVPLLGEITPYGVGSTATQIGAYALTNNAFDEIGTALLGDKLGKLGGFIGNQIGQNAQDIVLDTIPRYQELKAQGMSDEEIRNILIEEGLWNAGGNLGLGLLSEVPGLAKKGINKLVEKNAADAAFRQTVSEGAENLAKAAQGDAIFKDVDIPGMKNIAEQTDVAKTLPNLEDVAKGVEGDGFKVTETKAQKNLANEMLNNYTADMNGAEVVRTVRDSADMFKDIEETGSYIGEPILNIGRRVSEINNEALDKSYGDLLSNYENYVKAIQDSNDSAVIDRATKDLNNAISRFNTQAKKFDPSLTADINNRSFKNTMDSLNKRIDDYLNPKNVSDDIVDDWVKQDMDNPNRFVQDANKVVAEDIGIKPTAEPESVKGTFELPEETAPTVSEGLKERGQSQHIRGNGKMQMEGISDEVISDFEKNPDMYKSLRNADTLAKAEKIYADSANPETAFRELLDKKDPAALPLGHQIAKDYSAAGNYEAAAQLYRDMGKALTESGQFSQAAIINMLKDDPMTAYEFAIKEIDNLNDSGIKRFGDKWKNFELTPEEAKAFNDIKPGDSDAIKALYDEIGNRLGKEYPTTLMEKLIEARRVAMLFNPRTNVRNFGANPPTLAMRWLSDRVEAVGQNVAHLINPDIKVTQSLYGSGVGGRKLATQIYNGDQVQSLLNGAGSKADLPNLKNSLMENKQVFKGNSLENWIDKVTGNGIQKVNEKYFGKKGVTSFLETIRNATYKLLDLGDKPFVKENFVERLGSYIAANGIKNVDDVPDEAIQMAWEEAMKATYKDNSTFVKGLRNLKTGMQDVGNSAVPGLGDAISQAAIPYLQAPGNIAQRMVDYSLVGNIKGISNIVKGAKGGDVKLIEKGIEEAAKGLTGTGLVLLGMRLRQSGILTGTYSENKKEREFEKMNGFKEFAIHAGNQYFTYGWAQPFAQELMVGTLLADAMEKSDQYDSDILNYFGIENSTAGQAIGVAKAGTKAAVNSWFNESPLSGLADFFKGNSYSNTDIAGNVWENGVEDFASALVPSVVSATAKVADPVKRNTYDPSNAFATFLNSNVAKLPGLSQTLPAKYDAWGREMKYAESKGAAAASKYVIPGEYSYDKGDSIDNEITRLYEEATDSTGQLIQDYGVFPTIAPNKVNDKTLNNKEVSIYQKDMGERNRTLAEEFINSDAYKDLDDQTRVDVLKKLYGTSKQITERDKFGKEISDSSEYKKPIQVYDNAGGGEKGAKAIVDYYQTKKEMADIGLNAGSNAAKEIQADIMNGDTEAAQQKIDAATVLPELGLDKPATAYAYYKAQEQIPDLTPEDFAKTYKAIDKDHNQALKKKDEVIPYMNSQKMSYSEGMKFWKAYANKDWKLPTLTNGTWK